MAPLTLLVRAEHRPTERRAPLMPADVAALVADGVHVTVERCDRRIVPDAAYARAGARLADPGSWVDAPAATVVVGLKELPDEPARLRHRHVFFGHAYKGQDGADRLLARFAAGGGELYDLESLVDEDGRRLVAYGWWAGYVGAALAVLAHRGHLPLPLAATGRAELDAALAAPRADRDDRPVRALVLGARGRSGHGALAALAQAGVSATAWDLAETRELDRAALLAHDIVVNAVLSVAPGEPFLAPEHLAPDARGAAARNLSVIADVTCDVGSPCHRFPLYDDLTTWERPLRELSAATGSPPLSAIVIDNLPSLLPLEASTSFSAALRPLIAAFDPAQPPWRGARAAFHRTLTDRQEHLHV